MGVDLCKKTCTEQCAVKTVIMDDDTTTVAHLQKDYWSDVREVE